MQHSTAQHTQRPSRTNSPRVVCDGLCARDSISCIDKCKTLLLLLLSFIFKSQYTTRSLSLSLSACLWKNQFLWKEFIILWFLIIVREKTAEAVAVRAILSLPAAPTYLSIAASTYTSHLGFSISNIKKMIEPQCVTHALHTYAHTHKHNKHLSRKFVFVRIWFCGRPGSRASARVLSTNNDNVKTTLRRLFWPTLSSSVRPFVRAVDIQ